MKSCRAMKGAIQQRTGPKGGKQWRCGNGPWQYGSPPDAKASGSPGPVKSVKGVPHHLRDVDPKNPRKAHILLKHINDARDSHALHGAEMTRAIQELTGKDYSRTPTDAERAGVKQKIERHLHGQAQDNERIAALQEEFRAGEAKHGNRYHTHHLGSHRDKA